MNIGVLGGTFDPCHIGHLIVAEDVRWQMGLDEIWFIPNREPPHKRAKAVSPIEDRVAMLRLAITSNPRFKLSLAEAERDGPSYALDTLRSIRDEVGSTTDVRFLLGIDTLAGLGSWHEPDSILAEFQLVVMTRPPELNADGEVVSVQDAEQMWTILESRFPGIRSGVVLISVPRIGISASDIRDRVGKRNSIRYLVPDAVADYIFERGLYRTSS